MLLTGFPPNREPKGGLLSRSLKEAILGMMLPQQAPQPGGVQLASLQGGGMPTMTDAGPMVGPALDPYDAFRENRPVEGTDEYYLDKVRRGLASFGDNIMRAPGAQIMEAIGMGGAYDPVTLQEFDGLPPEIKGQIFNEMQTNPFFNLNDFLPPPGYSPSDNFDLNQMQRAGGIQVADAGGFLPEMIEQLMQLQQTDPAAAVELMQGLMATSDPNAAIANVPDPATGQRQMIGSARQGEVYQPGADGRLESFAIPGGALDESRRREEDMARVRQAQQHSQAFSVIQALGLARQELGGIQDRPFSPLNMDNAIGGFAREASARMPGTAKNHMATKWYDASSNIGFDQLQQMRMSSPTGGALGNVSDAQLRALQSVLGTWKPSLRPEIQDLVLVRAQNEYKNVLFGTPVQRALAVRDGQMSLEEARAYDELYDPLAFDMDGNPIPEGERQPWSNVDDYAHIWETGRLTDADMQQLRSTDDDGKVIYEPEREAPPRPQQALPAPKRDEDDDLLRWLEGN